MLLRRIHRHLERQDWFAVGLEFVIVVISILAAFQLQSWGEARASNQRAQQSLHQLHEESEKALGFWIALVRERDSKLEIQDRVVAALSAGDRGGLADAEITSALATLSHYPAITPPRSRYDELSGAGLLREIDAPEAMGRVSEYYAYVDFIQGQITHWRHGNDEYFLNPSAGLTNFYDRTSVRRRIREYDFEILAADPLYVGEVVEVLRNQLVFQFYRREAMHRAAEMCLAVAASIGEACLARPVYEETRALPGWLTRDVPPGELENEN